MSQGQKEMNNIMELLKPYLGGISRVFSNKAEVHLLLTLPGEKSTMIVSTKVGGATPQYLIEKLQDLDARKDKISVTQVKGNKGEHFG